MIWTNKNKWKMAATVAALIPIGFFLIFAVGEGPAGWSHYIQALIPIGLVLLAWWKPRLGGYFFIALGLLLGIAYPIGASHQPLATTALVELIVFIPTAMSGYLFLRAS
jgi:hypothetical protein